MSFAKAGVDVQLLAKRNKLLRRAASSPLDTANIKEPCKLGNAMQPASIFHGVESGVQHVEGDAPSKRAYHGWCQQGTQLFVHGGCVSTAYGIMPFSDFFVFDLQTMSWTQLSSTDGPGPRCKHCMCYYEGKIYIFGGWDGRARREDLWCYDIDTNTWSEIQCQGEKKKNVNWPTPHTSAAASIVGRVWVIVGRGETGAHKKFGCDIDFFDFSRGVWSIGGARFDARAGHSITPVRTMRMGCMIGGRKENPVRFFPVSNYADVETAENMIVSAEDENQWEFAHATPSGPPLGRSFHGAVAVPHTNHLLIHGGFLEGSTRTVKCLFDATSEVKIYDDFDDSWVTHDCCLPARAAHSLAVFMAESDDAPVAYVLLFGGTHRGEVFDDLWIQKFDMKALDKDTSPVNFMSLGSRIRSTDPKLFGLETTEKKRELKKSYSKELKASRTLETTQRNLEWQKKRSLIAHKMEEEKELRQSHAHSLDMKVSPSSEFKPCARASAPALEKKTSMIPKTSIPSPTIAKKSRTLSRSTTLETAYTPRSDDSENVESMSN